MSGRLAAKAPLTALFLAASAAQAQTIDPAFTPRFWVSGTLTAPGVPPPYGALTIDSTGNLLIGGDARMVGGFIYELSPTRIVPACLSSPASITALALVGCFCPGEGVDGGLSFAPNGTTLLIADSVANAAIQILPGSSCATPFAPTPLTGVPLRIGGLAWVPPAWAPLNGSPGAGRLKALTSTGNQWFDITVTGPVGGIYSFPGSTLAATLQPGSGSDGFAYVSGCPTLFFPNPSILVCERATGTIAAYEVNANGDPIFSTRREFASSLPGVTGLAFDPVTGDLLVSYSGSIATIRGFRSPCDLNGDGCINTNDVFAFFNLFFAGNADFNCDGITNTQDFFDFLVCFFTPW